MRKEVMLALSAFILVIVIVGAAMWLANAPLQPPSLETHQVLPDERIPH